MANRYWVGGSGTSWHTADNWASTSGGTGGAGVPTSSDVVYFDSNSNSNPLSSIAGATAECHSLITTGFSGSITSSSNRLEVWGNPGVITLSSTTTLDFGTSSTNAELWVSGTASVTITQNGATLNCNFNCGYEPSVSRAVINVSGNFVLSNQHSFEPDGAIVNVSGSGYISAGFLNLTNYATINLGSNGKLVCTAQAPYPPQTNKAPVYVEYYFAPYSGVTITGSNPRVEITAPGTGYTKTIQSYPTGGSSFTASRNANLKMIVVAGSTGGTVDFVGYHGDVEFGNYSYTVGVGSANFCGNFVVGGTSVSFSGGAIKLNTQILQTNITKTVSVNNCLLPNVNFINEQNASPLPTYNFTTNFRAGAIDFDPTFSGYLSILNLDSISFECSSLTSVTQAARAIHFNNSTVTVTGSAWNFSNPPYDPDPNLTVTYGAGASINMTSTSAKTFGGGGKSWPRVNQGGTGTLSVTGNNTFANFTNTVTACTVSFPSGTTTFENFNLRGTAGGLITLSSTSTLSKSSGTVAVNYLNLSNSTATGGADWYAGSGSVDGGGNTGWLFSSASTGGFLAFF